MVLGLVVGRRIIWIFQMVLAGLQRLATVDGGASLHFLVVMSVWFMGVLCPGNCFITYVSICDFLT